MTSSASSGGSVPFSVTSAELILNVAYMKHEPVAIFLMFSGGHDSLTATHFGATWASKHGYPFKVAHINTGIGIGETRLFVREMCERQGWPLVELKPKAEHAYARLVRQYGFPGPAGHPFMYRRLKERQVERLVREAKTKRSDRVMLITGARRQESVRRMGHADFQKRIGAQVWCAPLEQWSKADCNDYIAEQGLRRNEVVDTLHMSGECLCGAYARKDEMQELELWFPSAAERIHALEREVEAAGQASCIWGYAARYTNEVNRAQEHLFSPLCVGCESRAA